MVEVVADAAGVEVRYTADGPGNGWVRRELRDHGEVRISRMFSFQTGDLVNDLGEGENEDLLDSSHSECLLSCC